MYSLFIKRFIDVFVTLAILLFLLPVIIIVYIILYFANEGSPMFKQARPGENCKLFYIYKFKTMNDKKGSDNILLPDEQRITKIGKFVRKTSLDELPQLFNVLKGEMSLIGPRPLLPEYLEIYSKEEIRRHDVKPGITGYAQINGRNAISWKEKFKFDLFYINNISLKLDIYILFQTVLKVIKRSDISSKTNATMEKYNGKN
ncbi:MAG: sugar transferase [Flavobacteriales bacterium]